MSVVIETVQSRPILTLVVVAILVYVLFVRVVPAVITTTVQSLKSIVMANKKLILIVLVVLGVVNYMRTSA